MSNRTQFKQNFLRDFAYFIYANHQPKNVLSGNVSGALQRCLEECVKLITKVTLVCYWKPICGGCCGD